MMKKLGKIIIGLSLIPSSLVFAGAVEKTDIGLDSYIKDFHPQLYTDLEQKGVDLTAVEFNAENTVNNEDKGLSLPLAIAAKPEEVREQCNKYGGIFLKNNYIATCVSKDGTFGNGGISLGMTFNSGGTGTINSPDYLRPGTPHEFFSISVDGKTFTNNNSNGPTITGTDNIPTEIKNLNRYTSQEGGVLAYSSILGSSKAQGLSVTQKYTLDPNSREIIVRVEMRNTGLVALKNLQYARGLDPDQDRPKTYNTLNRIGHSFYPSSPSLVMDIVDVSPNNIAWSEGINSHLSVGLYSVDPVKHSTCISSIWTVIPSDILSQKCGLPSQPIYDRQKDVLGSDYSDSTINIAFSVGTLKTGEKKVFSYKYLFDNTKPRLDLKIK